MNKIDAKIETILGLKINKVSSFTCGFSLAGRHITMASGDQYAVKYAPEGNSHLDLEGAMLKELGKVPEFPVPEVFHASDDMLIMSWVQHDGGEIDEGVNRDAGRLIAQLHQSNCPSFGFPFDTLIGPLHQPNPLSQKWVPFFKQHRLLYMAREALSEGCLPPSLFDRLERFSEKLPNLLSEPAHPALLHGDLWGGNVMVWQGKIAAFIDPAIYWGHPEIELAFTQMFHTFGPNFFETYSATLAIEPEFHEVRKEIYNLYPTLVHVRLFGESYLPPIDRVLRRHGC